MSKPLVIQDEAKQPTDKELYAAAVVGDRRAAAACALKMPDKKNPYTTPCHDSLVDVCASMCEFDEATDGGQYFVQVRCWRGGKFMSVSVLIPRGSTCMEASDYFMVLADALREELPDAWQSEELPDAAS